MSLYLGENLISGQATLVGESRNIGQIIPSTIPLTDAGLHLLDGSLIQGSGIYSAFVDYIASIYDASASYFCTEAEWQTAVSSKGVCGKFVYDSTNNTVRLPKVTGIIEGTTDVSALGDLVEAGLPPIPQHTHSPLYIGGSNADLGDPGAYLISAGSEYNGIRTNSVGYTGNASTVTGGVYGNNDTVQPQTIKCYYYIVIATSTKTDIQVDVDEIATDLNSKADRDLNNVIPTSSSANAIVNAMSATTKNTIISWGMPDYSAGVSKAQNIDYSETTNGYLIVDYTSDTNSDFAITINGTSFRFYQGYSGTDYNHCNVGVVPIPKNVQYRITRLIGCRVRYFPCIGG